MRRIRAVLSTALACLLLVQPISAASPVKVEKSGAAALSTAVSKGTVASEMKVNTDLTAEEAATRLYYLGLMSGMGTKGGKIDFRLDRSLTHMEAVVMAVRLLGEETEALEGGYTHPFTDVPAWGSPYVGYFYEIGVIADDGSGEFCPDATVSSTEFMQYMFFALGYTGRGDGYDPALATFYGMNVGICTAAGSELTRGDAALMMLRTLNTSCAGEERMLSEVFVEEELFSYQDALFLLWCEEKEAVDSYVELRGYTTEKILPDGKYTIVLENSTRCLNVAVDGANSDYEGVGVTVWKRTDDISQKFRVVRTEAGTYKLYSCASGGGFGRMLGMSRYGTAALFSATSRYVGEYYIRCCDNGAGSWELIPVSDASKRLGSADRYNGSPVTLVAADDGDAKKCWRFEFDGVLNEEGHEFALYPSETLCVTQGAYDTYSHQRQNALDITTSNRSVYAPFTGKIVRVDRGWSRYNTVWLESCDEVVYADGSVDYMTVVFMHDDNVADLSVGQIISQGTYFYDMGVAGGATGAHVHIAVIRGKYSSSMSLTGSGNVRVEDALFIPADATVLVSYGLDWVFMTEEP